MRLENTVIVGDKKLIKELRLKNSKVIRKESTPSVRKTRDEYKNIEVINIKV
jgi:hypothetical protein